MDSSERRQKRLWWLFATAIAVACVILGVLQYSWIGEVSIAERERMRASLQSSLQLLSRDFNSEIASAVASLRPAGQPADEETREAEYLARYERWKESSAHNPHLFKRIALAVPSGDDVSLEILNPDTPAFNSTAWPAEWEPVRERLLARLERGGGFGPRGPFEANESMVLEVPRFRRAAEPAPREEVRQGATPRRPMESEWLLAELNADYLRTTLLPELARRHLGSSDYEVAVAWTRSPSKIVYQSDANFSGSPADAAVRLLDDQMEFAFRRGGGPRFFGRGGGPGRMRGEAGPPPPPPPDGSRFPGGPGGGGEAEGGPGPRPPVERGLWTLAVRHRAGSLEVMVQRGRWRNLAILAGLLAMMLAALGALIRFTQREQRLAKLQMDFVAGVSHELRTPLSVIRTAAHNLHGGLVTHPKQIQRYGALIRDESERLTGIVEQVLRFSGAQAGRVIQAREPVRVEALVEDALAATSRITDEAGCLVETDLPPELPLILADPIALKHALINLIANAAKYGFSGGWIGVGARPAPDGSAAVEITVRDRGPGIALKDQAHIFDAFFRGKQALEDQIHGTGLGLNLVKRIAEAHEGTVTLNSEPGAGCEFALRIPVAPVKATETDEFADTIDRG